MVAINNQAKQTRLGKHANISQLQVSHGSGWRQDCHLEVSLGLLNSGGLSGDRSGLSSSNRGNSSGKETGEGTDHGGVVDHVLGDVLLDSDMGHVLDCVVNIVADMLDNRGGGDSNRSGVVSGNSGGSNKLGSGGGDSVGSNSRGSNNLGSGSGDSVGSNSRGSDSGDSIGSNSGSGNLD